MRKILLSFFIVVSVFATCYSQITDPFFEQVTYIGAFGNTDWTKGWTNWDPQNSVYPSPTDSIVGDISASTTLVASKVYKLKGFVYVKSGVTLTIEAGTIIRGDKASKGTLIVEKGAKINAVGTASKPIVFTSNIAEGSRDYGDWGGVVICGNAKINVPGGSATIEGGPTSTYGGSNDADNSGSLKYVRIEFPGIPLEPNKEINGLTLGGVGNGTVLDYIQVSYSGDDSYEWFGGTVNAKHLIAFRGWDDDFDTDFGFRGKIQFGVSLRDPNIADVSGSNGFESDNDASGSANWPKTAATFCNMTVLGPKVTAATSINSNYKRSVHIRRNSSLSIYNSVFAGWPTGLFLDGTATQANANADSLHFAYNILSGMSSYFTSDFERNYFKSTNPKRKNDTLSNNTDLLLFDPFNLSSPDFLPETSSPVQNRSIWFTMINIEEMMTDENNAFIYPNPVQNISTVGFYSDNNDIATIELINMGGHVVKTIFHDEVKAGLNNIDFTSEGIIEGMYFLRITNKNMATTLKLIVQ